MSASLLEWMLAFDLTVNLTYDLTVNLTYNLTCCAGQEQPTPRSDDLCTPSPTTINSFNRHHHFLPKQPFDIHLLPCLLTFWSIEMSPASHESVPGALSTFPATIPSHFSTFQSCFRGLSDPPLSFASFRPLWHYLPRLLHYWASLNTSQSLFTLKVKFCLTCLLTLPPCSHNINITSGLSLVNTSRRISPLVFHLQIIITSTSSNTSIRTSLLFPLSISIVFDMSSQQGGSSDQGGRPPPQRNDQGLIDTSRSARGSRSPSAISQNALQFFTPQPEPQVSASAPANTALVPSNVDFRDTVKFPRVDADLTWVVPWPGQDQYFHSLNDALFWMQQNQNQVSFGLTVQMFEAIRQQYTRLKYQKECGGSLLHAYASSTGLLKHGYINNAEMHQRTVGFWAEAKKDRDKVSRHAATVRNLTHRDGWMTTEFVEKYMLRAMNEDVFGSRLINNYFPDARDSGFSILELMRRAEQIRWGRFRADVKGFNPAIMNRDIK
jgi:hypothetical protein